MPVLPINSTTNANKYEGTEKLLEVWFFCDDAIADLRKLSRRQILHLLGLAQCEIVQELHTNRQLSFVLSESSLFISDKRIILKTCGQTQLLNTVNPLIQYAMNLGFSKYVVYYSRRSFLYPELQAEPHRDFKTEIALLDKFCESGAGYTFGRLNGDCWNIYCGQSISKKINEPPGQTMEMMMRDLNQSNMKPFYLKTVGSAEEATKRSGIAELFPTGHISSHLFTPCGYSANGLIKEDVYFTIHVTPEPENSYASFETNVALKHYIPLIRRVLAVFAPESFICTFITVSQVSTYPTHSILEKTVEIQDYLRSDWHSACMPCGRKLTFVEFSRTMDIDCQ